MRDDVMPAGIRCSRCGGAFTRESPARPWYWSYGRYWPVHRQCPTSATLGAVEQGLGANT